MERPDFFTLKNGDKAKLPFSKEEYNQRVEKLRSVMSKQNLDFVYSLQILIFQLFDYIPLLRKEVLLYHHF
mgnify:CR=1 FL=1